VNTNFLRSSGIFLTVTLAAVCLLSGFGTISHDKNYECAGKSDNGMVPYREFPSLHFEGRRLKVSGSDIFSAYNYEICDPSGSLVTFATQQEICHAGTASPIASRASRGSLDKTSGLLELVGAQGLHGEYQCKEVAKK
jgi:hypothetical protein